MNRTPIGSIAWLAALAACDVTAPGPTPATTPGMALRQQALAETTACTPADLAWPAQTPAPEQRCAGSWQHEHYALCEVTGPECGPLQCDLYNECRRWEFGTIGQHETQRHVIIIRNRRTITGPGASADEVASVASPPCPNARSEDGETCAISGREAAERQAEVQCRWRLEEARAAIEDGDTLARVIESDYEVTYVNDDFEFECDIEIEYEIARARRDPLCDCSHTPYHPTCESRHSSCGTETLYSALGRTLSELPEDVLGDPLCLTCEELPLDAEAAPEMLAAQVGAKHDCLAGHLQNTSLPEGDLGAQNREKITQNLQILYELFGHYLDDTRRALVRELSLQHPEWTPACGAHPADLPICGVDRQPALDAAIHRCARMLSSSHVPDAVLHLEVDACLDLLTSAVDVADPTCRGQYLDHLEAMAGTMLDRSFDRICRHGAGSDGGCAGDGDGLAHLPAALGFLDRWYRNAAAAFAEDPDRVRRDLSATMAAFWRDVYQAARPFPTSVGDEEAEAALTALFEQGLWADRQVLAAAFSNARPLTSPPLLYLTADALRPLADRLEAVGPMLDLACRYKGCDPTIDRTEVADAWAVLAALHDSELLAETLAGAAQMRSEYVSVFARIRDHHAALAQAFAEATGRPPADLGQLSVLEDPGESARTLQQLVLLAGLRSDHFTRTGRFTPGAMDALHTGVQREKRLQVQSELAARTDALDEALTRYASQRAALANDLLAQLRNQGEQTAIRRRLAHAAMRLEQMSAELDGLREREAWEEVGLAQFMDTFDALMESGAVDPDALIERDVQTLGVSAQTGTRAPHDDNGWWNDIRDIGVLDGSAPWRREVRAGERVSFHVSGTWAPTCALRATTLAAPVGGMIPISIIEAQTGPEGYWVEWSNGQFRAHAQQTSTESFESSVDTDQTCFGAAGALTPIRLGEQAIPLFAGTLSASAQSCHETQVGTRQSSSTGRSYGQETRGSASFAAGLRVPGTPFARAPAGALLAVALARGEHGPERVVDVRVVRRASAFHYDRDVDVYLVVNDYLDEEQCQLVDQSPLGIEITHATPVGVHAETLAAAMQEALADLRRRADDLATSGRPTPSELGALRARAYAHLATASGKDLDRYPAVLRGYFDAWLERALASLERRAQMRDIERTMALTAIELRSAADDLAQAGERARLVRLLPTWRLRNLSAHGIERELGALLDLTERHLYPVLHLRYPSALEALRTSHTAALDALLAADFTAPVDQTAALVRDLARTLEGVLAAAEIGARTESPVYAAVAFPRPGDSGGGAGAPIWSTVDPARAKQVWDAILAEGTAALQVLPRDLYRADGGDGVLLCFEVVPVIESMAVVAIVPEDLDPDAFNRRHKRAPATIDPFLGFPDARGAHGYRMVSGDWLPLGPRLLFGRDEEALSTFHTWAAEGRVGNGLSPFSTFTVALGALTDAQLALVRSLVLVFELDTRLSAEELTWLETCQASGDVP